MAELRVRCPKCAWRPDGRAYWQCDACSTDFDTFATHARCPACGKSYLETQCIACGEWSLHEEWYEGDWPVQKQADERISQER